MINEWNKLPNDCVNTSSVNMFKNRIDRYLIWTLDKPMVSLSTCPLVLVVWDGNLVKSNICARIIGILNRLKQELPLRIKIMLYNTLLVPKINYCLTIWGFQCVRINKLKKGNTDNYAEQI